MSLRGFVETFPPLKVALYINDAVCFVFARLVDLVYYAVRSSFRFGYFVVRKSAGPVCGFLGGALTRISDAIPAVKRFKEERARRNYERLKEQRGEYGSKLHDEPVPYYRREQFVKRAVTYYGGLLLALVMYVFVYFVLVKRHTYLSVSVALLLLLAYLVVVENSHNIRSILMLCMPIMFTNRGRALVFCSMLALLAGGPIRTMHHNVREIHLSVNCCRQYLILETDEYVGDNVVGKLVRLETVVMSLVNNIKVYAQDLRKRLDGIIQMAIDTELYIMGSIEKLKNILNFCKNHDKEIRVNCDMSISSLGAQCNALMNSFGLCSIINRFKNFCDKASVRDIVCSLPQHVVDFFRRTIGRKLAEYVESIENEFYVDVDVRRSYAYNVTKSKSYSEVSREIKFDVERKFWYVGLIRRAFNFVSLILVTWIFLTATVYHMHYLRELSYDNMYLDERLDAAAFPQELALTRDHERLYLRPFSVHMNAAEVSKIYVSGLVWLVIVGYILFFVMLDFSLYQLVHFLVETLRDILFTAELPLINVETRSQRGAAPNQTGDQVVRYNRTYLHTLRKRFRASAPLPLATNLTGVQAGFNSSVDASGARLYTTNGTALAASNSTGAGSVSNSSIQAFYDRLIESLERDIPDDVAILESLESCLPKPRMPYYETYRALLYLALFTFGAVVVEAYALRTRHCIANLYYPRRARQRARWLFRKIMSEKPKYEEMAEGTESSTSGSKRDRPQDERARRKKKERARSSDSVVTIRSDDGLPKDSDAGRREDRADEDDDNDNGRPSLGYGFQSVE